MGSTLSVKLREGTEKAHTMTENVGFVKCFLKGVVEKSSYRKLVCSLYYVYSEMETQMRSHREHPVVGKLYYPVQERQTSLEEDMSIYYGSDWQQQISRSPATKAYIQRIQEIAATAPELLIAHSYTRYLGDLSGGQILQGIVQRSLNLPAKKGSAFYLFDDIADEKQFKADYRQRLDALPIDEATAEKIVDEANAAFELNMKVFQELEGSLLKSIGQMLFNSLTRRRPLRQATLVPTD